MGKRITPVPRADKRTEAQAARNLSEYDVAKAKQMRFRVPESLLEAVKQKASARGIPYTRYIRMLMEQDVAAK